MNHLRPFIEQLFHEHSDTRCYIPCRSDTSRFVNDMIQLLFPLDLPRDADMYFLRLRDVRLQLEGLLNSIKNLLEKEPNHIRDAFMKELPEVYRKLKLDADAICQGDPAAASVQEVIHAYPGFYAIAVYRMSHVLVSLRVPVLPRVFAEYAHSLTGIDINPGAQIGEHFCIDHGTGVVIGETSVIGNHVKIYQGVTLGALSVDKSMAATKRHPTIEDNVVIYAGSTVLGGKTIIGHDSVIGGNVWLTESVPPHSVVYHKSEVKIRTGKSFNEPNNFVI
jgi:serine O-acetyltransferase